MASEVWDSRCMKIPLSHVPRICSYTLDMKGVKEIISSCRACANRRRMAGKRGGGAKIKLARIETLFFSGGWLHWWLSERRIWAAMTLTLTLILLTLTVCVTYKQERANIVRWHCAEPAGIFSQTQMKESYRPSGSQNESRNSLLIPTFIFIWGLHVSTETL